MSNAAIACILADGKALLVKRSPDSVHGETWGFPGGKIEPGESALDAVIREIYEELRYPVLNRVDFVADDGEVVTYVIRVAPFTPTLNNEHTAYLWAGLDELPAPMHPGCEERLRKIMATKRVTDVNGWYEVRDNPISKVGIFPYSGRAVGNPDESRMFNVYRPEEELNNEETIRSFQLLPFINDHPTDVLGLDDDLPQVDGKPAEGVIGERVYYADGYLYGNLKIFTSRIAKAIEAGKREVSAGFRCMYEYALKTELFDAIFSHVVNIHFGMVERAHDSRDATVQRIAASQ